MIHVTMPPTYRAGGISAVVAHIAPGFRVTGHRHDLFTIVAVIRGELLERHGVRWTARPAGTVMIVPRGVARDLHVAGDGARVALFSCADGEPLARQPVAPAGCILATDLSLAESLDANACLGRRMDRSLEDTLIRLVTAQRRTDSDAVDIPKWVPDVCRALSRTNGRISTSELARGAGRHPVSLARDFRRALGIGLQEYGRRLRLERSIEMLARAEPGLSTIALETGFADQSHFTRDFVRRFGVSPGRYRHDLLSGEVSTVQDIDFPIAQLGDMDTTHARSLQT